MEPDRTYDIVTNPAWRPFTEADVPGYVVLLVTGVLLIGMTVWTYAGSSTGTRKRIGILVGLRLVALFLAVMVALRPSAAVTEIPKLPSTLIVVIDSSESMTLKDEANLTRWEVVQQAIDKSTPILDQMREDQQTTVYVYHFSKQFEPERDKYNSDVKPEGKGTDIGTLLSRLYDRHQAERQLRGLIILSDGRHNTAGKQPEQEILRWRGIGCPVYCFAVGQAGTASQEKDVSIVSINADPSPVAIKSDLKIKARLNAPGFEGLRMKVRLKIEGLPDRIQDVELSKAKDNEIEIVTKAPDKPGEVKVTLELVDPPQNQVTRLNDSIETYLTVTKEGVRVLIISKDGWELKAIRRALASDKRFDYVEAIRATEVAGTVEDARRFDVREQRYDAIIIGDVTPRMLTSVRSTILEEIRSLVRDKGVGFMMLGGQYSLAGSSGTPGATGWSGTPIADLLPVTLPAQATVNPGGDKDTFSMEPTEAGLRHYLLRLGPDGQKNKDAWRLLNTDYTRIQGYNLMGEPKRTAEVLARANNAVTGDPLMVRIDVGAGRSLAFAVSDTWLWSQPGLDPMNERTTIDLHARFWKQVVLWLAHQDEVEGAVYVRPEHRRLVANGRQTIRMGLRDKRGDDVAEAEFKYQIVGPNEAPDEAKAKRADRDPKGGGLVSFEAKNAGEFTVVAWGKGNAGGEALDGRAEARYVVFPEVSDEMLNPAAYPELLALLENTANGTALEVARRADRLPQFLEELKANPPKAAAAKPRPYPEWRRDKQKWFLPLILVIFVAILGLEWGLRRSWGMV